MLEHVPRMVGEALQGARAGMDKVASRHADFAGTPASIEIGSAAFASSGPMPPRFTADGAGVSPPLTWRNLPAGAAGLVLIVEDPDAPAMEPLVHALVLDLPAGDGGVPEAGLKSVGGPGEPYRLGKNSFLKTEYLPPDPPTGHGPHRYCFQLFALDRRLDLPEGSGRGAVLDALRGHVLAHGTLVGTYERT